jgi:serine protease SohB
MRQWIPFVKAPPRVAVVRLTGMVAAGGRPGSALNDAAVSQMLDRAFSRSRPSAVALVVNSPGGSPVQSSLMGARIRRLADEKTLPVFAFVEDVAASGGYWIATAADEIWIDPMSVVGSIGVISASFGAHEFIERYGIERRIHTAGKSKSLLDPFRPERAEDVERLERILDRLHTAFIGHVKDRRAAKLATDTDLFNGDIWVGEEAVSLGLVDGIGHLVPKMKERFGDDVRFIPYGPRRGLLQRLGAQALGGAVGALEERAEFARFGL